MKWIAKGTMQDSGPHDPEAANQGSAGPSSTGGCPWATQPQKHPPSAQHGFHGLRPLSRQRQPQIQSPGAW